MNSSDPAICLLPLPGQPGTWLAGRASGLARSDDDGVRWRPVATAPGIGELPVTALSVTRSGDLLAGTLGGIMRSSDGGESWRALPMRAPAPTVSALAAPSDDLVLAASLEDGVLHSQDGGRSWESWNFGLLDPSVLCLVVAGDGGGATVLAGTGSGIVRSTTGGRSWSSVTAPGDAGVLCMVEESARPGIYYAGTEAGALLSSSDGGATWQVAAALMDEPVSCLVSPVGRSRWVGAVAGATLLLLDEALSCRHSVRLEGPALCAAARGRTVLIGCASGRVLRVTLPAAAERRSFERPLICE